MGASSYVASFASKKISKIDESVIEIALGIGPLPTMIVKVTGKGPINNLRQPYSAGLTVKECFMARFC